LEYQFYIQAYSHNFTKRKVTISKYRYTTSYIDILSVRIIEFHIIGILQRTIIIDFFLLLKGNGGNCKTCFAANILVASDVWSRGSDGSIRRQGEDIAARGRGNKIPEFDGMPVGSGDG